MKLYFGKKTTKLDTADRIFLKINLNLDKKLAQHEQFLFSKCLWFVGKKQVNVLQNLKINLIQNSYILSKSDTSCISVPVQF